MYLEIQKCRTSFNINWIILEYFEIYFLYDFYKINGNYYDAFFVLLLEKLHYYFSIGIDDIIYVCNSIAPNWWWEFNKYLFSLHLIPYCAYHF